MSTIGTAASELAIICSLGNYTSGTATLTNTYNNNGTLGNVSPTITINSTACTLGSTCTVAGNNAITDIRSYATLAKSTDDGDGILSWYGVTKTV